MKSVGRDILWNLPRGTAAAVYALSCAAAVVFALGVARRVRSWGRGRAEREDRLDRLPSRARDALRAVLGHRKILERRPGGPIHAAIFFGFAGLVVATGLVAIEHDLGVPILDGPFYIGFKLFAETSGLLLLLGVGAALARRVAPRPAGATPRGAGLGPLVALGAVAATGFLVESLRLAATAPAAGRYSYASHAVAALLAGAPPAALARLHRALWWTHLALALGFLASLPYGKMVHAFAGPANVFLRSSRPRGALQPIPGFAALDTAGAGAVEDFSWKQLLDLDACVDCGRCDERCPAHVTGKPLSPRQLVRDLRARLGNGYAPVGRGGRTPALIGGGGVAVSTIWACTTCGQCAATCPVAVEHVEKIVDLRRHLVLGEGAVPDGLEQMFRRLELYGDPWGMGAARRTEWTPGPGPRVTGAGRRPALVYWVGCAGAFDPRAQAVSAAMTRLLAASGVDFAIMGAGESCCGDFARRAGNEYLFHRLAERNLEAMRAGGVERVVTACPHCYNALRNEYPPLGGTVEVVHHSEWIAAMLDRGALRAPGSFEGRVAYHDPCYLGRCNGVYEPPRAVLRRIVGVTLLEADRNREAGFCCGAGGGALWLEEAGERLNTARARELLTASPDVVATACPHCLAMLEDGLSAAGGAGPVPRTLDIAEIVARGL